VEDSYTVIPNSMENLTLYVLRILTLLLILGVVIFSYFGIINRIIP
jgi:hypothetical protein